MKAFNSMGIDNKPFTATGVYKKDDDILTMFLDENYIAAEFAIFMKRKRVLKSLEFYGECTFTLYGPFFVKSVHGNIVTLIKG